MSAGQIDRVERDRTERTQSDRQIDRQTPSQTDRQRQKPEVKSSGQLNFGSVWETLSSVDTRTEKGRTKKRFKVWEVLKGSINFRKFGIPNLLKFENYIEIAKSNSFFIFIIEVNFWFKFRRFYLIFVRFLRMFELFTIFSVCNVYKNIMLFIRVCMIYSICVFDFWYI